MVGPTAVEEWDTVEGVQACLIPYNMFKNIFQLDFNPDSENKKCCNVIDRKFCGVIFFDFQYIVSILHYNRNDGI